MRPTLATSLGALTFGAALLWGSLALAHAPGLSRGDYRRTVDGLDVELGFAPGDAALLLPELDLDRNGTLTQAELEPNLAFAAQRVPTTALDATQEHFACTVRSSHATSGTDGSLDIRARLHCPEPSLAVAVSLTLLEHVATGHRHAAHLTAGDSAGENAVYFGEQRRFSLPPNSASASAPAPSFESGRGFVRLGFEHILSGADHAAFLLGLALCARRLSSLLKVVSAFTVAHSLTLALVVLKLCAPPVSLVEAGIALSVAYVGVETLRGGDARWPLAFGFGLLHGFGFAGALSQVSFPVARLASTLLLFNVGVELGQLALLAAFVPLLTLLRRFPSFGARATKALSVAVLGSGLLWFASRCIG